MGVELSVVVNVDAWMWVSDAVACLEHQSIADSIELILVCPSIAALGLPADPAPKLRAVRVVENPIVPVGAGRAAGIGAATGRLVVIGETHVYPEPQWAEQLLAAYDRGYVAVVPLIRNANPSALTWSGLLMDYGPFCVGGPDELGELPRNNVAFGRNELLAASNGRLEELLGPLGDVVGALARVHGRVVREPRAETRHLNVSQPRAWAEERLLIGRMVGGSRGERWSRARRYAYAAAAPLIAGKLGLRGVRMARTAGLLSPKIGGVLAVAAVIQAAGEALGYLSPDTEGAERQMLPYEVHKIAFAGGPASVRQRVAPGAGGGR